MSFELTHKTKAGTFHVRLERDLSLEEMCEVCQIADNLLPEAFGWMKPKYGPEPLSVPDSHVILGEYPIDAIDMGSYEAPNYGVRVDFFYLLETQKDKAAKILQDATGISFDGCLAIVCRNFICPALTPECANAVMEDLKKIEVYAKIVPTNLPLDET